MPPLTDSNMIEIYKLMVLTRQFEVSLSELFTSGLIAEHPHSSIGQEAIGSTIVHCLQPDDLIMPSLRTRGAMIAKGVPLNVILSTAFPKATSVSGGKWTSHHMAYMEKGVLWGSSVIGGGIPIAVGAALAAKYKGLDRVTVVFFGDGATSRGDFHEALNLAAVMVLPILFICENNQYALSTPIHKQMKIKDITERSLSYGIPGFSIDGNDVIAIYETGSKAVDRARSGLGPSFIGCHTYRWRGHSESHPPEEDRSSEEIALWMERCPIRRLEETLCTRNLLNNEIITSIQAQTRQEIEDAIEWARNSPDPNPEDLLLNVFAEPYS